MSAGLAGSMTTTPKTLAPRSRSATMSSSFVEQSLDMDMLTMHMEGEDTGEGAMDNNMTTTTDFRNNNKITIISESISNLHCLL
jgi:hypothetical protein